MRMIKFAAAALAAASAIAVSGCAMGLPTQVSRYQAMPAPQGQSFYVIPANPANNGLEFARYASLVGQAMQAQGYAQASSPSLATMLVAVDYGVDRGTREYDDDPLFYDRYGYGGRGGYGGFGFGTPYYSRFGYYGPRSPYYYGWGSPFGYDPFFSQGRISTVYQSFLDLNIRRNVDHAPLFEGHAKARSSTDNLGTLVPNLVTAMFTGFPGRSGETIRITVPPVRKGQ